MLVDKKILESERNQVYVKSNEGVRLNGSVEENKDVFDTFFRNLLTGNAGRPLFFITQPKGEVRWTSPFGFFVFLLL